MIPIILVSQNITEAEKYVKKLFLNGYLIKLEPEATEYSINQIRAITKETSMLHPALRVYFLSGFDHSSSEAQNAFLKLLEEPPSNLQFVLQVNNQYKILDTIRSRTKIITLKNKSVKNTENETIEQIDIEKINLNILAEPNYIVTKKEKAIEVIDKIILLFKRQLQNPKTHIILSECLKVRRLIDENNLNPQMAIDHLLIFIGKQYSMK